MVNNNYDYLIHIPYRIRIGVTGHRKNLPPLKDLQTAIQNALVSIFGKNTTKQHQIPSFLFLTKNLSSSLKNQKTLQLPLQF